MTGSFVVDGREARIKDGKKIPVDKTVSSESAKAD